MPLLLLLACQPAPSAQAPTPPPLPPHQRFPTAEDAVRHLLASAPRVIGIGEVHASTERPGLRSTMSLFTERVLPLLAPQTTDLVIETWRLDRACGAQAEQVVEQVQTETQRPEETPDEILVLARAAKDLGVTPHDLVFTCEEYATVLDEAGEVSYDTLLRLLTVKLGDYAQRGLSTEGARVVLYGGALHNDLFPEPDFAAYSYGPAARAAGGAAYLELDLYDASLLRGREGLIEAAWAPLLDATSTDHALLYERGPQSFVLFLEEQTPSPPLTAPPDPAAPAAPR